MEKKIDNLKYILNRYDNYINASNVKGTFLVALNTFIVGSILVNKSVIVELIKNEDILVKSFNIIIFSICISALLIIFFTIKALFPYTASGNSTIEKYHSHIFFNSVSQFNSNKDFTDSFDKLNDSDFESDLGNQIYVLAKGLNKKFMMLNRAMYIVYFELILFAIILILILIG